MDKAGTKLSGGKAALPTPASEVRTRGRPVAPVARVVGARDLARVDVMIDERSQEPYLLEINTLPGFTSKSLLPEAAGHAGIPFSQLVDRLVKRAAARAA